MIIDCETCVVRGLSCSDCVMSTLLSSDGNGLDEANLSSGTRIPYWPALSLEIDHCESDALSALADSGLLPPLRLVAALGHDVAAPVSSPTHRRAAG